MDVSASRWNRGGIVGLGIARVISDEGRIDLVAVRLVEGQRFPDLHNRHVVLGGDLVWGESPYLGSYDNRLHTDVGATENCYGFPTCPTSREYAERWDHRADGAGF